MTLTSWLKLHARSVADSRGSQFNSYELIHTRRLNRSKSFVWDPPSVESLRRLHCRCWRRKFSPNTCLSIEWIEWMLAIFKCFSDERKLSTVWQPEFTGSLQIPRGYSPPIATYRETRCLTSAHSGVKLKHIVVQRCRNTKNEETCLTLVLKPVNIHLLQLKC